MTELTRSPGLNGHFIINDLALWEPVLEDFIAAYLN